MSLTDNAETYELFREPVREKHHPHFMGDSDRCDFRTGHCTNTTACHDCKVYQSMTQVKAYEERFRGF